MVELIQMVYVREKSVVKLRVGAQLGSDVGGFGDEDAQLGSDVVGFGDEEVIGGGLDVKINKVNRGKGLKVKLNFRQELLGCFLDWFGKTV